MTYRVRYPRTAKTNIDLSCMLSAHRENIKWLIVYVIENQNLLIVYVMNAPREQKNDHTAARWHIVYSQLYDMQLPNFIVHAWQYHSYMYAWNSEYMYGSLQSACSTNLCHGIRSYVQR